LIYLYTLCTRNAAIRKSVSF